MQVMTAHPIPADLEGAIRETTAGRVRNLRVYLSGESLVLEGESRTFYGKQLAQHVALTWAGGHTIRNEITVTPNH